MNSNFIQWLQEQEYNYVVVDGDARHIIHFVLVERNTNRYGLPKEYINKSELKRKYTWNKTVNNE